MPVFIYRLTDDRDGWNHVATIDEDGEFTPHTDFAAEEIAWMISQYELPDQTDALLEHFTGPYIHAREVDHENPGEE